MYTLLITTVFSNNEKQLVSGTHLLKSFTSNTAFISEKLIITLMLRDAFIAVSTFVTAHCQFNAFIAALVVNPCNEGQILLD